MSEGQDSAGDADDVPDTDVLHADDMSDDDAHVLGDGTANQVVGAEAKSVLEFMARQIVDEPDAVVIEPDERGPSRVDLRLHVAPDDMGKIIGRRGRVAQAIRTVVRAVGAREGVETTVDIVD